MLIRGKCKFFFVIPAYETSCNFLEDNGTGLPSFHGRYAANN